MRYGVKWPTYAKEWDAMQIKPASLATITSYAKFAIENKAQYQAIEAATGVPWPELAAIHRRESDADFGTYLGNGQRLDRVTTEVPKGRGPFLGKDAFVRGAIDALQLDHLTQVKDWRLEKELFYTEAFNGGGYDARGLPSPYVWGGTNIQVRGKFTSDGKFSRFKWDPQPGTAPLIYMIAKLDPSVQLIRET